MKNITIYPHGKLYVFYLVVKYTILIGLGAFFTYCSFPLSLWSILLFLGDIILIVFIVLQTYEIFRYKMIIEDKKVRLYANRDLFLKRHKDLVIDFKGIKSLQFKMGMNLGVGFISAIVLYYDDNRIKYLNTMRFSKKQVDNIMLQIRNNAEVMNGSVIGILEDDIQGGV